MSDLVKSGKLVIPVSANKFGLAKRIAEKADNLQNYDNFPNRLGIVFDDSGSMYGEKIEKAHEAIDIFIKSCNNKDTALAIYPLNMEPQHLNNNFAVIGTYAMTILATGGTPLYSILHNLITNENITRAIAFSDGRPTDSPFRGFDVKTDIIKDYINKNIPIDTVLLGSSLDGKATLVQIAEATGGTFLHFTDASVLAKNLKYLAPRFRAMLEDGDFRKKVERGEL